MTLLDSALENRHQRKVHSCQCTGDYWLLEKILLLHASRGRMLAISTRSSRITQACYSRCLLTYTDSSLSTLFRAFQCGALKDDEPRLVLW